METVRFGFIGVGNIACAIVKGILSAGYINPDRISLYDVSAEKTQGLVPKAEICRSAAALTRSCKYVFLTVKPQVYPAVLKEIRSFVTTDTCLITVAAGRTIEWVKEQVGFDCKVIRVMPNTPLMVGCGASALVHASPVTDSEFETVKGCFSSCGVACTVEEKNMDTVTAVSGSSPAFIFRFARELIRTAVSHGLSQADAQRLVFGTLLGSARMILESGRSVEELIRMVTSPNGTTEAGLKAMDQAGFDQAVERAVEAAEQRSVELRI
ncbi:MAG: pyrroline-5-carboxylate reductase [Clostridiales bacterium]|nr:pyrroline-5-carboxylate reductase [Clostridiales bacterium]